jgi:hypothetical protein
VAGGYPTVDLHIADVPYGSLSRAQVALQANPKGWLSTAVLSSWLASATLADAWLAGNARSDVGSTILVTFAAALVAVLARPDRHRMITRLLATIRLLAAVSATVTFAGALVFAFVSAAGARAAALEALFFLSLPPAVMATLAWATATARLESRARRSPWEQRRPPEDDTRQDHDRQWHARIVRECRSSQRPYNRAVALLEFDEPAIKVASAEGARRTFNLDPGLLNTIKHMLSVCLDVERTHIKR